MYGIIGGKLFETRRFNLLRYEGTYFHSLLGSDRWKPDNEGAYFIDISPELFEFVMEHMRGNNINVDDLSKASLTKLKELFDYFQIPLPSALISRTSPGPAGVRPHFHDPRLRLVKAGEVKMIDKA